MGFLLNQFWGFALISFVIILCSAFVGALPIALMICIALHAYIIKNQTPLLVKKYKEQKAEREKRRIGKLLNQLYMHHTGAIHLALVIFSLVILAIPMPFINLVYNKNQWFLGFMHEHIPAIRNHINLAATRSEHLKEIYSIILPQYYFLFFVATFPFLLNLKHMASYLKLKIRRFWSKDHLEDKPQISSFLIITAFMCFIIFSFLLEDGVQTNRRGPFLAWDSSENNKFLFVVFCSWWIFLYTMNEIIRLVIKMLSAQKQEEKCHQ